MPQHKPVGRIATNELYVENVLAKWGIVKSEERNDADPKELQKSKRRFNNTHTKMRKGRATRKSKHGNPRGAVRSKDGRILRLKQKLGFRSL